MYTRLFFVDHIYLAVQVSPHDQVNLPSFSNNQLPPHPSMVIMDKKRTRSYGWKPKRDSIIPNKFHMRIKWSDIKKFTFFLLSCRIIQKSKRKETPLRLHTRWRSCTLHELHESRCIFLSIFIW